MDKEQNEQSATEESRLVDIGKVVAAKFKRPLPSFAKRFLEKWICQDEINYVLSNYGHLEGIEFAEKLIEYFSLDLAFKGEESYLLSRVSSLFAIIRSGRWTASASRQ